MTRTRATLVAVAALIGWFAALPAVAQSAPPDDPFADTFEVSVVPGTDGRVVRASGSGFAPGSEVQLILRGPEGGEAPAGLPVTLEAVTTDEQGSFDTNTGVPDDVPDGDYVVVASGQNPDGSPEEIARRLAIGSEPEEAGTSTEDVFRWVGYTLLALGAAVLLAYAGRWVAAWRESRRS